MKFSLFLILIMGVIPLAGYDASDYNKLIETKDCIACDLRGADLHDLDFSGSDLQKSDLRGANLAHSIFFMADLSGADLSDVNASNTVFWKAAMQDANLTRIHAKGANFKGTSLERSDLSFADLRQSKSWKANFSGALTLHTDFTNSELGDAKFVRNDLRSVRMKGALLWQTHFESVRMSVQQCQYAKKEEAFLDSNSSCK